MGSPPLGGLTVLKLIKLTHEQGLEKCGSEPPGLCGVYVPNLIQKTRRKIY